MGDYLRRVLSIILIMVFALTTTQSATVLAAEGRTAKIYDYSNEVSVIRGKADLKVFKGMRLKEGDTIKTGKSSNAYIEIDSDKVIKLDSLTIVTMSNLSGTAENGSINISLSSGKIFNDIKKKLTQTSTYKVRTPNAVMGVRGTTFVVDMKPLENESSETVLTVLDGTVAFTPSEQADLGVYVGMNQTSNANDLTKGNKPIITEMKYEDLTAFELKEIVKDTELKQNIKKLLDKEDKTLEEILKQAEEQEQEMEKQAENQEQEIEKQAEEKAEELEKQAEEKAEELEKQEEEKENELEKQAQKLGGNKSGNSDSSNDDSNDENDENESE